ncbi:MAG: MBL fold metallo-hydrolase [Bacteroidetes bacterium]|nr:MAG: MBL fold metallo-hydrolase [Bacteroidota bacterium]
MAKVVKFTFNPFQENTYLVVDEGSRTCVIFDPGCYDAHEKDELATYIEQQELRPVRLMNTHCHLDHIFGNRFVAEKYGLPLEIHRGESPILASAPQAAMLFGLPAPEPSLAPGAFLEEGDQVTFGNTRLEVLLTPGHSPASLSFFCPDEGFVIAGDVLFYGSIGRTDLPGGDFDTLIRSIREKLLPLGDQVVVHPGHGPDTTIGFERRHNPFLQQIPAP